jgi:dehydratase
MKNHGMRRARRGLAGLLVGAAVMALTGSPVAAGTTRVATTPAPVAYDCFVTFPGGSTVVHFGLTFDVAAPATTKVGKPFKVVLDTPAITPNPSLQTDVRDVAVKFKLPANTAVLATWLTGGSGLGDSEPEVDVEGGVLTLRAAGPFPSATPFDLPAVNVLLVGVQNGSAVTATGGTSFDDPSFSWTRNSLSPGDPPGTLRPFECQPPAPVTFTTTDITR